MNEPTITVWVTKYALTRGIYQAEATTYSGGKYAQIAGNWSSFKLSTDAFKTEAEAKTNAEARRKKKIASLRKQIKKLQNLTF